MKRIPLSTLKKIAQIPNEVMDFSGVLNRWAKIRYTVHIGLLISIALLAAFHLFSKTKLQKAGSMFTFLFQPLGSVGSE
jgi:hypothetical protein